MNEKPMNINMLGNINMLEEGFSVTRKNSKKPANWKKPTIEDIIIDLKKVYDPEVPVNIYDLGLIYDCKISKIGNVKIIMTLTSPMCPIAEELPAMVADEVIKNKNISQVKAIITWSPPWSFEMMSDDAKMSMDIF